jgi:similar to stage IV sporulation protein
MFVAVWAMSLFVWEIDVYGNEKITTQQILSALEEQNVGIGSFGPSIVSEAISNDLILRIPELAWIAVNVYGSRADILVRERIEKPEIPDMDAPTMVYAVKPGIIVRTSVLQGVSALKPGDTVASGDILISGIMDSISHGKRTEHAMGEIWARTCTTCQRRRRFRRMRKPIRAKPRKNGAHHRRQADKFIYLTVEFRLTVMIK